MPQIEVTKDLINLIHNERKKHKIVGSKLSKELKKNTSFITNLENNKIKYLDIDILYNIFDKIIDLPEDERNDYISNIIMQLSVKFTNNELLEQEWMITFDMQKRLFPLTEEIIKLIQNLRNEVDINEFDLVEEINKNKYVEEDIEPNKLKVLIRNNQIEGYSIKFKFEKDYIKNIESGKVNNINYIDLLGILYNLLLLKELKPSDAITLAEEFMNKYGIYTLVDRNSEMERRAKELSQKGEKFKAYEIDLDKTGFVLQEINKKFQYIKDCDIDYTYKKLHQFYLNMDECLNLTFALIGLDFTKLKALDNEKRKEFLNDINSLIEKYEEKNKEILLLDT